MKFIGSRIIRNKGKRLPFLPQQLPRPKHNPNKLINLNNLPILVHIIQINLLLHRFPEFPFLHTFPVPYKTVTLKHDIVVYLFLYLWF